MKKFLVSSVRRRLPRDFDVDRNFTPSYKPWDQRLCLAPDGDLFDVLADGSASMRTSAIDRFTRRGLRLSSGEEIQADIVITATGLRLLPLGGLPIRIDGVPVDVSDKVTYKGCMLDGVPNFVFVLGYTNASWTLKADLVSRYVSRLLGYLDAHGFSVATPKRPTDTAELIPLIDLGSGYIRRSLAALPRQGSEAPWRLNQSYDADRRVLTRGHIADEMTFATPSDARQFEMRSEGLPV
tara:strand:+ start:1415 stop:2131 length:717 start_codon:yes stop_codon:yes gene_type:complete